MTEITPTYYARGEINRTFTLKGDWFKNLPAGAIGIMSTDNDTPLMNINNTSPVRLATLVVSSNKELVANNGFHNVTTPSYLGAIVSADRQSVYWVNETRPIPEG